MPSVRCLISALTEAGGGDLLLRFASSIQSCCGEGGPLQADVAVCVGSTRRVLAQHPAVLAPSPRVLRALSLRGEQLGRPEVWRPVHRRRAFSLHGERPGQPEVWHPLYGRAAPFPSAAPARCRSGLRKSLDRNRGLFAGWEGVASLGLSLPLSPPPASYLQRGWSGSSLEFLSPFLLRTAGGVFQPVSFSLALPQFKKISLRPALRAFWPVPTLRNASGSSPFRPPLAGGGCGRLGYFSAGSCF